MQQNEDHMGFRAMILEREQHAKVARPCPLPCPCPGISQFKVGHITLDITRLQLPQPRDGTEPRATKAAGAQRALRKGS